MDFTEYKFSPFKYPNIPFLTFKCFFQWAIGNQIVGSVCSIPDPVLQFHPSSDWRECDGIFVACGASNTGRC